MSVLNNVCLSVEQKARLNENSIPFINVNYNKCMCPVIDLIGIAFIAGISGRDFISLLAGMYIERDEYLYVAYYLGEQELSSDTIYNNCIIDYTNEVMKLLLE